LNLKLVPDARHAWKWISIHALWLAGILPSVWDNLPHKWQDAMPFNVICICTAITAVVGIVGRLTDQNIDLTPPTIHEEHEC